MDSFSKTIFNSAVLIGFTTWQQTWRSRTRFLVQTAGHLWLQIALVAGASIPAAASQPDLGMNYSWFQLGSSLKECQSHPAAVLHESGIIPQYDDEAVRQTVRQQLAAMRQAGFDTIRTFVSLRIVPGKDWKEGSFVSQSGVISDKDRRMLGDFVSDIAKARFKTLEVAFGSAGIYCHHLQWGDCYNSQDAKRQWQFDESATKQIIAASHATLDLRFDLGNEGCPAPTMPDQTLENAKSLFVMLARNFSNTFGKNWLISCPNSPNDIRQKVMLKFLKGGSLVPAYLEVHSYSTDEANFQGVLSAANLMATSIDAKLILGELAYHSSAQAQALLDWMHRNPTSRVISIIQWPHTISAYRCPIDVPPPYDPGSYRELINR